jgi:DNA-binding NarL/FixJ family response regulator
MNPFRILLVDDHAIVRAGIRNAIENLPDVEVVGEAADGPSLIRALQTHQPDILLIDVTMPDFEPISAIHRIKANYPTMKILVISAYDDDVYVQGLLGAGVDGYHLKDQPLQDLSLALGRIIKGERWISSSLVNKLISPRSDARSQPELTCRQREVLTLLKKGWNNQKIAYELSLSIKTIENHLTRLYRALDVQSRLEAVNYLNQHPEVLISPDNFPFSSTSTPKPLQHSGCILVVDDNPRFRRQLRRTISHLFSNMTILEADSTEAALAAAQRNPFLLAFVDVLLGEQSGISCVRQIKTLTPKTRVVLISAYPDKEFHRQGMKAGAAAFIDKKMLDSATIKQIIGDVINSL